MTKFRELPSWIQLVLAIAGILVSITLAFGSVRSDVKVEVVERKAADALIQQQQDEVKQDIHDIKNLMQEEFDRHHPRQK